MLLRAISISESIPKEFDVTVHSVFRTAVNLHLGTNQLITVFASSDFDLPQGIRIDAPDDFSFEIFHTGDKAICRNESLRIGTLIIELRGARLWTCDLPALRVDLTQPAVFLSWKIVWQVLNSWQIESHANIVAENFDFFDTRTQSHEAKQKENFVSSNPGKSRTQSTVAQKASDAMRGLVEATRQFDLSHTNSPIRTLIGLGFGLTPSGDDLLVGYLAGLWCTILNQSGRAKFVPALGIDIIQHSSLTNDISRTYLHHAARGQVSSLLANLAEAIGMGLNGERLIHAAEAAMRVGHTSGIDAVTGLLIGLNVWSDV